MLRSTAPAIRIIGATLTPARGSPEFGAREEDRKALNAFIRTSGLFDAVIDLFGAGLANVTNETGLRMVSAASASSQPRHRSTP